ncbi:SRPBCC family protein [Paracoccus spongiarum]|uniref:SRPBCC family protein n=1 Tax=Paracoccus spongiarum TaxID=3064387 RepID=A0ABT9JAJ9_9RHOB|nr:SRPBCC family protein [Paracoccus sp. 2205BS29-5]MDP5306832.1 SRPBCC family protein [Paracoccus sp. 2205BS29-5]
MSCHTEAPTEAHALVLDRVLTSPRDKLWRCWTDPVLMEEWFCPKPWQVRDVVIDLRPGGEFTTVMHGPEGEVFPNTGVFLQIDEGRKLVFTDAFLPGWRPSGRPFMVAEILFEDAPGGGTRYVATARHWTAEASREHEEMGFHEGWDAVADQLDALAATLQEG